MNRYTHEICDICENQYDTDEYFLTINGWRRESYRMGGKNIRKIIKICPNCQERLCKIIGKDGTE